MDAEHTLRVVAQRVASRIAETGIPRKYVADAIGADEGMLAQPADLTIGQVVALGRVLETSPADFFPAGVTRTGVAS